MDIQEIFNTVVRHLHKQGKPSKGKHLIARFNGDPLEQTVCAYRGSDGGMCAVGCLIKNEFYNVKLEGESSTNMEVQAMVESSLGIELTEPMVDLLRDLQECHDSWEAVTEDANKDTFQWADMSTRLGCVMRWYKLNWPEDVPQQ